ncbi:MAG: response regulator, partial [Syntrophaceae bacterium]|nr:response regulator [Syntrophaceae bacterium]
MSEKIHILIIEDVPTDAELCEREVRKSLPHSEFMCVDTEKDYLAALKSFQPGLIISDYAMPQFDGMTALKLALKLVPETPFIILTGSMNEETAVECMKAGAWDYVIKEHIRRLGPAVVSVLRQAQLRKKRQATERELLKSEELFRKLFEEHSAVKLIVDPDTGWIINANDAAANFYGWSRERLRTMKVQDINTLPPEKVEGEMKKALASKRVRFEFRHRLADNSIRDVEVFS